jgi:hypothetical protein
LDAQSWPPAGAKDGAGHAVNGDAESEYPRDNDDLEMLLAQAGEDIYRNTEFDSEHVSHAESSNMSDTLGKRNSKRAGLGDALAKGDSEDVVVGKQRQPQKAKRSRA